jgi:hypothetical protein
VARPRPQVPLRPPHEIMQAVLEQQSLASLQGQEQFLNLANHAVTLAHGAALSPTTLPARDFPGPARVSGGSGLLRRSLYIRSGSLL